MKENNKEYYKEILITQYHYSEDIAERTVFDLENMDDDCKEYFNQYVDAEEPKSDLIYQEYSVKMLMYEYEMLFPSAVIYLSKLKKDYENYSALLNMGIK